MTTLHIDTAKIAVPGLVISAGGAWVTTVAVDLLRFRAKVVSVRNRGSHPLTAAQLQTSAVSADADDQEWETLNDTAFATLAPGALTSLAFTDAHVHWRLRVASAAGTVVDVHFVGGA